MQKTYLVAKRDVNGFCLTDEEGYEVIFDLKEGSTVQVYDAQYAPFDPDDDEVYVHMFGPHDVVIVSSNDFDIERR